MNNEKCSIIIPVFNAEDTIKDTIESVLNGTYKNIELLIIDDCSTDNSRLVVEEIASRDPRVRHFKNAYNQGGAQTRNNAIQHIKGKYTAYLDSDDLWEASKLDKCIAVLESNPDVKLVAHDLRYIAKNGKKVGYIAAKPRSVEEEKNNQEKGLPPLVFTSTAVLHTDVLIEEGGFDPSWSVGQDTEFFARVARHGIMIIKEPLGSYRLRSDSITGANWLKKRLARNCVIENNLRERKGLPLLTLDQYVDDFHNNTPLFSKLHVMRDALSRRYWRRAGGLWLTERSFLKAFVLGAIGSLLAPRTTLFRVRRWIKTR